MQVISSKITIEGYALYVFIGISPKEREEVQKIQLNVSIYLNYIPNATHSDKIEDTICYHNICKKLETFNKKEFKTIEFFSAQIFKKINNIVHPNRIKLEVVKFPNIKNLEGSVKFMIKS